MSDRALSFGRLALDYDRVRPGYPPAALRPVVGNLAPLELGGFAPGEVRRVPWQQPLAVDDLVLLFSTFSRVSTREPADRDRVLESIRMSLAGRSTVSYPYVCVGLVHRRTPG